MTETTHDDKVHIQMSPERYLDLLDQACEDLDRSLMATLERIAFARGDLHWQAAARAADNYIIATTRGDVALQARCQDTFMRLVPLIRAETT